MRLVAVYDRTMPTAVALGREHGVRAVATVDEVLAREDVDAVLIATSHDTHHPIALAAARAGKHIFCEKPMALTVAQCAEMISAADEQSVRLLVGHVSRQLPAVRASVEILQEGDLGAPVAILMIRHQELVRAGWWSRRSTFGGMLHSPAIHNLDLMNYFLGTPRVVFAQAGPRIQRQVDYEDVIMMQIGYEDGGIGALSATISDPLRAPAGTNMVRITCERGALRLDLTGSGSVQFQRRDGALTSASVSPSGSAPREALRAELQNLADWINGEAEPFVRPQDALRAVELCEAAYRSIETATPVHLPLVATTPT